MRHQLRYGESLQGSNGQAADTLLGWLALHWRWSGNSAIRLVLWNQLNIRRYNYLAKVGCKQTLHHMIICIKDDLTLLFSMYKKI